MSNTRFVSIPSMGINNDLSQPEITICFVGPRGAGKYKTVTPENARILATALIKAADDIEGAAPLPPMPPTMDRQPIEIDGYFQSDLEWVNANAEATEWLADNHVAIRKRLGAA